MTTQEQKDQLLQQINDEKSRLDSLKQHANHIISEASDAETQMDMMAIDVEGLEVCVGNQAPVVVINGPYNGFVGEPINFSSGGTFDPEGDGLTYAWEFVLSETVVTSDVANPSLVFNELGTFTATLTVCDVNGNCSTDSTEFKVSEKDNQPPVVNPDAVTTYTDEPVVIDVLANDIDVDGTIDPSTLVVFRSPLHGNVVLTPGESTVTYTPNMEFVGTDTFEYQVADNEGAVGESIVTVDVLPRVMPGERLPTLGRHRVPDFAQIADKIVEENTEEVLAGNYNIIAVKGKATINSDLQCVTILVYPEGTLELSTGANITIKDVPLDVIKDPEQLGNGLIVLGTIKAHGVKKDCKARCADALASGSSTVTLQAEPMGWKVGDLIGIADSRAPEHSDFHTNIGSARGGKGLAKVRAGRQNEERYIVAIDGTTITFDSPLTYGHEGAYDRHGVMKGFPYLCNLTRDIVIKSENPEGTRGHIMFAHRADVDFNDVEVAYMGRTHESGGDIDNLGVTAYRYRGGGMVKVFATGIDQTLFDEEGNVTHIGTNQEARYAIHWHHCIGPVNADNTGYQFKCTGCSVYHFTKWGYTIHETHYGLIQNCVAWLGEEAGFMFEAGNENENRIEDNFSAGTRIGFWLRGKRAYFNRNVAAANDLFGQWFSSSSLVAFPLYRGHDPVDPRWWSEDSTYTKFGDGYVSPIENDGNEAYSFTEEGHLFGASGGPLVRSNRSYIREDKYNLAGSNYATNTLIWNGKQGTIFYQNFRIEYDGLEIYNCKKQGVVNAGTVEVMIRNFKIHNCTSQAIKLRGRDGASRMYMENGEVHTKGSYRNRLIACSLFHQGPVYDDKVVSWFNNVQFFIDNDEYGDPKITLPESPTNTNGLQQYFVNGEQIFSPKQHPDYVITDKDKLGDEFVGMTNQQAWDLSGVAWMGEVASCTDNNMTNQGFLTNGFVCPVSDDYIKSQWEFISLHQIPARIDPLAS